MATSPTLADQLYKPTDEAGFIDPVDWQPATREDILTVVRELGGVDVEARQDAPGWRAHVRLPRSANDGDRYLIIPIEEWCISHGQAESDPSHPRDKDCRYG